MKRGTPDHPKTLHLAELLGIERWGAIGILESLWHWTAKYAPDGAVGRWSARALSVGILWPGDAQILVDALITAQWLDKHAKFGYVVHDWSEHCDEYVHIQLARKGLKFCDGSMPRITRLSKDERASIEQAHRKRTKSAGNAQEKRSQSALPSPPLPSPSLVRAKARSARASSPLRDELTEEILAVAQSLYARKHQERYLGHPDRPRSELAGRSLREAIAGLPQTDRQNCLDAIKALDDPPGGFPTWICTMGWETDRKTIDATNTKTSWDDLGCTTEPKIDPDLGSTPKTPGELNGGPLSNAPGVSVAGREMPGLKRMP